MSARIEMPVTAREMCIHKHKTVLIIYHLIKHNDDYTTFLHESLTIALAAIPAPAVVPITRGQ